MEISMIVNSVKLMAVMDDYSFDVAVWNLVCFKMDNVMIINHSYHEVPFEVEIEQSQPVCPAGYPIGYCYGCGRCEW